MRPHEPTMPYKARGIAAAKVLLKDSLWWIRGYPLARRGRGEVPWMAVPELDPDLPARRIAVTGDLIRRATYGVKALCERFPRIIHDLFDDPKVWAAGVRRRLEALSAAVHKGEVLPAAEDLLGESGLRQAEVREALEISAGSSSIRFLLGPFAWTFGLFPESLRKALRLFVAWSSALEAFLPGLPEEKRISTAISLFELLLSEGELRMGPLLRALCDPRSREISIEHDLRMELCLSKRLEEMIEGGTPEVAGLRQALSAGQKSYLCPPLLSLTEYLSAADPACRRRALQLLNLVLPKGILDRWESWWAKVQRKIDEVEWTYQGPPDRRRAARLPVLCRGIKAVLRDRSPPDYPVNLIIASVQRAAALEAQDRLPAMVSALRFLPEHHGPYAVRASFLLHWDFLSRVHAGSSQLLERLIRALGAFAGSEKFKALPALLPWTSILKEHFSSSSCELTPDGLFICRGLDPDLIPKFFDLLKRLLFGKGRPCPPAFFENHGSWDLLETLIRMTDDGKQAAEILEALFERFLPRELGFDMGRDLFSTALYLSDGDPKRFARLASLLAETRWEPGEERSIHYLSLMIDEPEVLSWLIEGGEIHRVKSLAVKLRLLRAARFMEGEKGKPGFLRGGARLRKEKRASAEWISRYPKELRGPLKRLARDDPHARRSADHALGGALPDSRAVLEEIEALRERLPGAPPPRAEAMRRRLENLEARIRDSARSLSPEKVSHLREKIERRIGLSVLKSWEEKLDGELKASMSRILGGDLPREWTEDRAIVHRISHLFSLQSADFRRLALRILKTRLGPPPWDFREAPENRAFLDRMRRRGLRMEPWLDGIEPLRYTAPSGEDVTLALERDPIEIFGMGEPFLTCLSPGGMNFFSTVANAADINKKVLYARGRDGKAVGRCLLALTREGRILTFHPYSVNSNLGIQEKVAEFVKDLARRMGASYGPRREVENLVAKKWYDDGPQDVLGRFKFLEEGSDFRTRLAAAPPSEILALCREAFAPDGLDWITLPLLLNLQEFNRSPDLILPLLPHLESLEGLDVQALLRAASLCLQAGKPAKARTLIHRILSSRPWLGAGGGFNWTDLAGLILDTGDAAAALRILRSSRGRRIRGWEDEDFSRLKIAARAHDALGRPRLALRLYRKLLQQCSDEECRSRAEFLQRMLPGEG